MSLSVTQVSDTIKLIVILTHRVIYYYHYHYYYFLS